MGKKRIKAFQTLTNDYQQLGAVKLGLGFGSMS